MLRYEIYTPQKIVLSLDVISPNKFASVVYEEGEENAITFLKSLFDRSAGAFGHIFSDKSTTAIDLDCALKSLILARQIFKLKILEGESIISTYKPSIPNGAVT